MLGGSALSLHTPSALQLSAWSHWALTSGVFYRDPWAALDWLEKAFGFERCMVITDKDGNLGHSELRLGEGLKRCKTPLRIDIAL